MTDFNTLISDLTRQVQCNDVEGGKKSLAKIKILMLDLPVGPNASKESLALAATALELGVLLSVADEDLDAFARNISQLKPYYTALPSSQGPAAPAATGRKCHVLGLNLMHLLVENRLSEFHAELELLSEEEAKTPFVSFPITLERQLMVGSYDEVLNAGSHVPDPSYGLFMTFLLETVRDSIADCLEVSYKTMKLTDAVKIMKFESTQQLLEYIEEKREDWIVEEGGLTFQPPPTGSKASDIPSMNLIAQSLSYATELERIV